MDVTPQLLQDIEFREKVRGYHPDDVDDFLERVGVAFSELVDRLRQANDRADAAEAALAERAEVDETALSRTLVLAQRTADAAIAEAKAEAELARSEAVTQSEQTVNEAKREAEEMVAEAQAERDALLRDAESDARARAAAVTGEIEDQIARLEERRSDIVHQSTGLESWLAAQRVKLESVATDLQEILDDPDRLRADAAPHVPELATESDDIAAPLTLVESEDGDGAEVGDTETEVDPGADEPVDDPTASAEEPEEEPAEEDDESGDELHAGEDLSGRESAETEVDDSTDIAGTEPMVDLAEVDSDDLEDRPSRVSVVRSSVQQDADEAAEPAPDAATGSNDSFLEELRRAVEAPTDVVESDEDRALSAFFDHEDEEPKRRFGRRR